MHLGAFSISLAVKDIAASLAFYEKLGFDKIGGAQDQGWIMLRQGTTTIGLFQGMFEDNIITFNPGWDADCNTLESFTDVREIAADLEAKGLTLVQQPNPGTEPTSITLIDPDGNPVLIDQHVPAPQD